MKSLEVPEYSCPSAGQCGHGAAGSRRRPPCIPRYSALTDQQCSKGLPGAVRAPSSPRLQGMAQQPHPGTLQGTGGKGWSVSSRAALRPSTATGSPHLPTGSQLHEGADGLIGAGPAGQHMAAVVGLQEADEVGALGLLKG